MCMALLCIARVLFYVAEQKGNVYENVEWQRTRAQNATIRVQNWKKRKEKKNGVLPTHIYIIIVIINVYTYVIGRP